jgi:GNAT superfamily N-acetyltransferase
MEVLDRLRRLLAQLSPSVADLSDEALGQRLCDDRLILVAVERDGDPVAAATLSVLMTAGVGLVGHVDDVVVDESVRGGGVGRLLMEAVHTEAERLGLGELNLTSRPAREAANALYKSLGYERRETNVYRLRFER